MKIIFNIVIFLAILLTSLSMAAYTEEEYIKVAKDYIKEKYSQDINCKYRVVIDNSVFIYIDQLAYDTPISTLDSVMLIDKDTKEVIHANLRIKTEIYERYVVDGTPLTLEEIPEFINKLNYNEEYKINAKEIKVIQKKNFNNYYDIENVPFVLKEEDNKNTIEVEKIYEPITKNNRGNVYELAYYINYTDEKHNAYNIVLFAYTKEVKKNNKVSF